MKKITLIIALLWTTFQLQAQSDEDVWVDAAFGELHLIGLEKMSFASDQYVFKKAAGGMTINSAVRINGKLNAQSYFLNGKPLINSLKMQTSQLSFGSVFQFPEGTFSLASFSDHVEQHKRLPRLSSTSSKISLEELNKKLVWQTEELSLYILELHKEVETLKEQVKQLQSN